MADTYTTGDFVKATGEARFLGWPPGAKLYSGTFTSAAARLEEHQGSSATGAVDQAQVARLPDLR